MNKNILLITISLISLFACGEVSNPTIQPTTSVQTETPSTIVTTGTNPTTITTSTTTTPSSATTVTPVKTYTITWKNYDGTVLETDYNVQEGTMPSYNGTTPVKQGTNNITYLFNGWTPNVKTVTEDMTYTATFFEYSKDDSTPGINPTLNSKNEIEYGFYPQTNINDSTLITQLETLTPNDNGWYFYNGEYYVKETAKLYNTESYKFDNGTAIVEGTKYWFKCETIKWKILKELDGTLTLLSTHLLDANAYYDSFETRTIDSKLVHANNYKESNVRKFLNEDFYNDAFNLNNKNILNTQINNDISTIDNKENNYVCENTTDKVFLLSYKDYLDANYGFETNSEIKSSSREAKTTDYARARGAFCNTDKNYTGSYWTRSPSSEYDYCAWNVNSAGYISEYVVLGNEYCIRPSISISI